MEIETRILHFVSINVYIFVCKINFCSVFVLTARLSFSCQLSLKADFCAVGKLLNQLARFQDNVVIVYAWYINFEVYLAPLYSF
jgi:hypothetical protein